MNRRNFFSRLSAAIVGVYIGCHVKLPEVTSDLSAEIALARHQFESNLFSFYPSFQDFLNEHLKES